MKIARLYTFKLKFLQSAKLPKWKGAMLRGSIGYWLKRLFCITSGTCENCSIVFKCPFGYLFRARSKGIVLSKLKGYAKPYVLKPPLSEKQKYAAGDELVFSFILFGDAVQFESELIKAVLTLCDAGIGERDARGRAELESVCVENPMRGKKDVLFENGAFYDSSLWIRNSHLDVSVAKIFELRFLTPFRLIKDGALLVEPTFVDLAKFMLRKYSAIRYQYIKDELDFDHEKFLKAAEKIKLRDSALENRRFIYKGKPEDYVFGKHSLRGKDEQKLEKGLSFLPAKPYWQES